MSYFYSQTISLYKEAARALDILGNQLVAGSLDKQGSAMRLGVNEYGEFKHLNQFPDFIYSCRIIPENQGYLLGCKNKIIYQLDELGVVINKYTGHEGPVNSLAFLDENTFVSGSWDATARVWALGTPKSLYTLSGHAHGVSVLAIQSAHLIITGSQDGNLHFWSTKTFQKVNTIQKAHNDMIREIALIKDFGFITCSNDETIKIWTLDGEMIQTLLGHKGFIFSVIAPEFGKYISGSDDKTIKLWDSGAELSTLEVGATVWAVAFNHLNQDIVAACSDGSLKIFTLDPSRKASEKELAELQGLITSAQVQESQQNYLTQTEVLKLPGISELVNFVGKRNGEVKLFRNGKEAEAYSWKVQGKYWEKIGEVMTQKRKYYPGDKYFPEGEYDYLFNVENDEGATSILPYNEDQGTWEVAEKYCCREGLSKAVLSQITEFIKKNSKQSVEASKSQSSNQSQNPQSSQNRPQKDATSIFFPNNTLQLFESFNIDGLSKKVKEFNSEIQQKEELQAHFLSVKEVHYFDKICQILKETELYYNSKFEYYEFDLINQKLLSWPDQYMLPIYDLLKIFALHPQSEKMFSGVDSGIHAFIRIVQGLVSSTNPNLVNLILKLLCNLFENIASKGAALRHYNLIFDGLHKIKNGEHKGTQNILSLLLFNYSTAINQKFSEQEQLISTLIDFILERVRLSNEPENSKYYLMALGNIATANKFSKEYLAKKINPLLTKPQNDNDNQTIVEDLRELTQNQ